MMWLILVPDTLPKAALCFWRQGILLLVRCDGREGAKTGDLLLFVQKAWPYIRPFLSANTKFYQSKM